MYDTDRLYPLPQSASIGDGTFRRFRRFIR
jgi:hypothetical protein